VRRGGSAKKRRRLEKKNESGNREKEKKGGIPGIKASGVHEECLICFMYGRIENWRSAIGNSTSPDIPHSEPIFLAHDAELSLWEEGTVGFLKRD